MKNIIKMTKIGFITGISGQDGSYLAELLLEKNYKVYGMIRRHSNINTQRIDHIYSKITLFYGDMTDQTSIQNIFQKIFDQNPHFDVMEVYNLAAQSHVKVSFDIPDYTTQVDALGTLRLLESILQSGFSEKIRFYQASTSELYGDVLEIPQNEKTPFNPQSPYAIAKLYSYWIVKNYRNAYNIFACNGILFNHTSPRRGETFVCRKITQGIANIVNGKQKCIVLGNIDSERDLGHAKDYVYGMWLMLQQDQPKDYVLSMNESFSIRSLIEMSFEIVGIPIYWTGDGINERACHAQTHEILIRIDSKYFRPTEVQCLLGDSSLARQELNWRPHYNIVDTLTEMIDHDLLSSSSSLSHNNTTVQNNDIQKQKQCLPKPSFFSFF